MHDWGCRTMTHLIVWTLLNVFKTFLADAVATAECNWCAKIGCKLICTDWTDQKLSPRWCLNGHSAGREHC